MPTVGLLRAARASPRSSGVTRIKASQDACCVLGLAWAPVPGGGSNSAWGQIRTGQVGAMGLQPARGGLVSGDAGPILPLGEEAFQAGCLAGRGPGGRVRGVNMATGGACLRGNVGTLAAAAAPGGQARAAHPGFRGCRREGPGAEQRAWQGRGGSEGNRSPCWVPTPDSRGRCGLGVIERWEAGESRGVWPRSANQLTCNRPGRR